MIGHEFPYTNLHDVNIDWILQVVKEFNEKYHGIDDAIDAAIAKLNATADELETAMQEYMQGLEEEATAEIGTAKDNAIAAMNQLYSQFQTEANEAINSIIFNKELAVTTIDNEMQTKLAQVSTLLNSLPHDYQDALNSMQIINSTLNGTYNYPELVQGHYADSQQSDSKTLVADDYRVSSLLSAGCASRKLRTRVTNANGIIRDIIYWTGWGDSAVSHSVVVSSSPTDEKTMFTYTFPPTASYFTVVFASNYNMTAQLSVSDIVVAFEWIFDTLQGLDVDDETDVSGNVNGMILSKPSDSLSTWVRDSEKDHIDVGHPTGVKRHYIKDSTARTDIVYITGNNSIAFSDPTLKQYIQNNFNAGVIVNTDTPSVSQTINNKWACVPCSPGDTFTINGKGGSANRLFSWLDSDKALISKSGINAIVNNLVIIAPEDAAYLVINSEYDVPSFYGTLLVDRMADSEAFQATLLSDTYFQALHKDSDVFTTEEGYMATSYGKVTGAGYVLCYMTATKDFDFYASEDMLARRRSTIISIYSGEITAANFLITYRLTTSENTMPTIQNKAHISKGQTFAISVYTPSSNPGDFDIYANYELCLLNNNIVLNENQIQQVLDEVPSNTAKFTNFADAKTIAWFGDSISQLRQLPHITGNLLSATVYDCSIKGSTIGRTYTNYDDFSFSNLVTSIISGDFTAQDNELAAYENEIIPSTGQPRGPQYDIRENLANLKNVDFTTLDYLVLLSGTNDFGITSVHAGEGYSNKVSEMQAKLEDALSRFITAFPAVKIFIISPPFRATPTVDYYGNTLADYVNAEGQAAEKFAIPFCNLLTTSRICDQNKTTYMLSDGGVYVHPNDYGDAWLAELCAKFIATH